MLQIGAVSNSKEVSCQVCHLYCVSIKLYQPTIILTVVFQLQQFFEYAVERWFNFPPHMF